jgi:hypothetical protein
MSGYKDRMYWASSEEIAAYLEREPQSKTQTPANGEANATPHYESFSYRDEEGNQVSVAIQKSKPETYHGMDI